MNFMKTFLHFFISITTAIVALCAGIMIMNDYAYFPREIMLQVLGAAAATALITTVIFSFEPKSRKMYFLLMAVHYVLLCCVMVPIGMSFGWIDKLFEDGLIMCIYVALVYALVYLFSYLLLRREADKFNQALDRRRREKEQEIETLS